MLRRFLSVLTVPDLVWQTGKLEDMCNLFCTYTHSSTFFQGMEMMPLHQPGTSNSSINTSISLALVIVLTSPVWSHM